MCPYKYLTLGLSQWRSGSTRASCYMVTLQYTPSTGTQYCNMLGIISLMRLVRTWIFIHMLMPCTVANHKAHFSCFSFILILKKSCWLHVALVNPFHEGLKSMYCTLDLKHPSAGSGKTNLYLLDKEFKIVFSVKNGQETSQENMPTTHPDL